MVKILTVRLSQYVNWEHPDVQAGFWKGRGTRDQIADIRWFILKGRELQKNIYFCFIGYMTTQTLTVWITTNCGKFFKRWEHQTTLPASWEICMQVKKQQLDMKQWTGSKLGKEYVKTVCCHPAYLTSMQRTSREMPAWVKHKLESIFLQEISITSDMHMTPRLWQKAKRK